MSADDSLVQCLLDSALEPVINDRIAEAAKKAKADSASGSVQDAQEQALLNITVCDPACGSGHFLIAAAHRLANRLARIRSGETEPVPDDYQHALRDVIRRCLYGVDINPMAAELCKVSLWIESIDPGRPLSFLDHHIKVGNSLLGTTPALMAEGIPDDAFKPLEGDKKDVVSYYKKRNKQERKDLAAGQKTLLDELRDRFRIKLGNLPATIAALSAEDPETAADVAAQATVMPNDVGRLWHIAAALASPVNCAIALRQFAGAALSAEAIKISAKQTLAMPIPSDQAEWDRAAALLRQAHEADATGRQGLLIEFAQASVAAFAAPAQQTETLLKWWIERLRGGPATEEASDGE